MPDTIRHILADYVLRRDLAPNTEIYYRRTVGVFCSWAGRVPTRDEFTPRKVSEFLRDKQQAGTSSHYRKSLRNGLRALLNHEGKSEPIRQVSLEPLEPEAWTPDEIAKLIAAVDKAIMPRSRGETAEERRRYWRTLIESAYHLGLSQCDMHRLDRTHLRPGGLVEMRRSKTAKKFVGLLPLSLLEQLQKRPGPFWPMRASKEFMRRQFNRIVARAGLYGTFKKLRKSSGTAVELAHPGRGHEHLANTRAVLERHYMAAGAKREPLSPPPVPRAGD